MNQFIFRICYFCLLICPVFICGYKSVIDSILVDAPPYLIGQGDENTKVLGIENIVRCGPMSMEEIMLPPNINYNISACIAMDNLEVQVKLGIIRSKFSAKYIELAVNVTVETGLSPKATGTVKILEWTDPKFAGLPIGILKGMVEKELTNQLNKYLDQFIQMDNAINPRIKGQL
ncbi:unnamed protein product [Rodentolepis nana]|uniref:BPI1 domain-containing protein n=1 Tax=Rodentolepis nana TaxID=102285 RepID=A0A0R3TV00_RODNA|nr:unnamed protein product [Rodentolepis nana]